jgi:hypothetical protein
MPFKLSNYKAPYWVLLTDSHHYPSVDGARYCDISRSGDALQLTTRRSFTFKWPPEYLCSYICILSCTNIAVVIQDELIVSIIL